MTRSLNVIHEIVVKDRREFMHLIATSMKEKKRMELAREQFFPSIQKQHPLYINSKLFLSPSFTLEYQRTRLWGISSQVQAIAQKIYPQYEAISSLTKIMP